MIQPAWLVGGIAAVAVAGVIVRPFGAPEFVWAVGGAVLLVLFGLLPAADAAASVWRGMDVYLFLTGMMLLSELARQEGLFAWLAARMAARARGSAMRLFTLVFALGTVVTVFLSNDATAVVLTPAVAEMARKAEAPHPLPYLLICAFVANAASFVLPISNPANLVLYGRLMPPLLQWLPRYALPSVLCIGVTYGVLRLTQRRWLRDGLATGIDRGRLSAGGAMAALGIGGTAIVLLTASAFGIALGLPTCLAGIGAAALVRLRSARASVDVLRGVSWGVLPLVAGLFVLVAAVEQQGLAAFVAGWLRGLVAHWPGAAPWVAGGAAAGISNLANNLPVGLMAGRVVEVAQVPERVREAMLIGVDVGPNLSVTGSLATILWLGALRREGVAVTAWGFLGLGALVMPPALVAALAWVLAWG